MNPIIRSLRGSRQYFIAFTLFLIVTFISCSFYSKADCFIGLNTFHSDWLDNFFTWYTMLGDGVVAFLLLGWFLFRRRYLQGIHIIAAFITSGIVAQVIKMFSHMPRPKVYLHAIQYQHFIEGITRGGWSSFPSGHTATAFALATILALHNPNKWAGLCYLLLAISVGYSRIYLGHHFLEDVLAGSIIGVCCAGWVFIAMPELRIFGRRIGGEPTLAPLVIQ